MPRDLRQAVAMNPLLSERLEKKIFATSENQPDKILLSRAPQTVQI